MAPPPTLTRHKSWSELLFEHLGDGLIIHDRFGKILDVNPAACAALGYTREEFVAGMTVVDIDPSISLDAIDGLWARMPMGKPVTVNTHQVRKNGTSFPAEVRVVMVEHDGEPIFITTARDVTEREIARKHHEQLNAELKQAHKQMLAANHAKDRFLANMSHELRTPLNAIIGYTEILGEEIEDEQQQLDIARVLNSSQHLLNLINDILDLSKLEAGHMLAEPLELDLSALVSRTCDELGGLVQEQHNTLELDIEQGILAQTDGRKVAQILTNMFSNACKFTSDGTIRVTLARDGHHHFTLSVSDTGDGISQEHLTKLFSPFYQAKSEHSRFHKGTGLGLAICKNYAALLGGAITVESTPGEGSTFSLLLPLDLGEAHDSLATLDRDTTSVPEHVSVCLSLESSTGFAEVLGELGWASKRFISEVDVIAAASALRPELVLLELSEEFPIAQSLGHELKSIPTISHCRLLPVLYMPESKKGMLLLSDDVLFAPLEQRTLEATLRRNRASDKSPIFTLGLSRTDQRMFPQETRHLEEFDALERALPDTRHRALIIIEFDYKSEAPLGILDTIATRYPHHDTILLFRECANQRLVLHTIAQALARWGAPIEELQRRLKKIAAPR